LSAATAIEPIKNIPDLRKYGSLQICFIFLNIYFQYDVGETYVITSWAKPKI
jgi:hypothetical protein